MPRRVSSFVVATELVTSHLYFEYYMVRKFFHWLQLEYHHGLKDSLCLDGLKITKLLGFCFPACAVFLPERFIVHS